MKTIFTTLALILTMQASAQLLSFEWANLHGNTGQATSNDIVADSAGNTFTTGSFSGTMTVGSTVLVSTGLTDCFLIKRDATGAILWAKSWGGFDNDVANSIALDASGNIIIGGIFKSTVDFNPGSATANLTSNGDRDGFVLKLNAVGNFIWANPLGGTQQDYVRDVTVDASDNIYVGGQFKGTMDVDPSSGTYNLISKGDWDIFFVRYSPTGSIMIGINVGGTGADAINAIEIDNQGDIYCTGYFRGSADFDPTASTYTLVSSGISDAFLAKYTTSGAIVWANKIGGTQNDLGLVVRKAGNDIMMGGYYKNLVDFDPSSAVNASTAHSSSTNNGFVAKYDAQGNYIWHGAVNSVSQSRVTDIQINDKGQAVMYGLYEGNTLFSGNTVPMNHASNQDIFIWYTDSNGVFVDRYRMLTASNDVATRFTKDANDNLYFTGHFSQEIDVNVLADTLLLSGTNNGQVGFVMKYNQKPNTSTAVQDFAMANLKMYPNPVSSTLFIEGKVSEISVYDLSGKLLIQTGKKEIDVASLAKGIYILKATEGAIHYQAKFVKK